MAASLVISTSIENGLWKIVGEISSSSDIPQDVFIYENLGAQGIGEYQAVCSLAEYLRLKPYVQGVPVAVFGNKYLKSTTLSRTYPLNLDVNVLITKIKQDLQKFRLEYLARNSSGLSQVITL